MIFKQDWVIAEFNFAGVQANPKQVLEVGAIRLNNTGMIVSKYESLVKLENVANWDEKTWKDHGLELSEVTTAPTWYDVLLELLKFCHQADLTGWLGHDTMGAVRMGLNKTSHVEGLFWAYQLDLRSYYCALSGELLSRDIRKLCTKFGISSEGIQRPLIRCQRVTQIIEVLEEKKQCTSATDEKYELYEI